MIQLATSEDVSDTIESLFKKGRTSSEICDHLAQSGILVHEAEPLVKTVRDVYYAKQRKKGMPLLAIGAIFCVLGCLMALLNHDTGATFHVGLYGMTGVGATSIIAGLMYVLG